MKSNSAPASMMTPSKVVMAPWMTGANMCWSVSLMRLLREPKAVRNPCNQDTTTSQNGDYMYIEHDNAICNITPTLKILFTIYTVYGISEPKTKLNIQNHMRMMPYEYVVRKKRASSGQSLTFVMP